MAKDVVEPCYNHYLSHKTAHGFNAEELATQMKIFNMIGSSIPAIR